MIKFLGTVLFGISLLIIFPMRVPVNVHADNDAMDYVTAPPGTRLALFYYQRVTANEVYANGTQASRNVNLQQNLGIIRYVHFTKLGPITMNPQILMPFADATLDGKVFGNQEISATGLADLIITSGIWFIDDPEIKIWLGLVPFLYFPIGDYDEDRALNIGQNRWRFRPELGFARGFDKWHFDLTASVAFYGDNDDYLGDSKLEQEIEYHVETHLTYKWTNIFNLTFSWFHHMEGETSIDGADQGDEMDDHRVGVALAWWLTPQYQLVIKYSRDIEIESGFKQNLVGVRFLHAF